MAADPLESTVNHDPITGCDHCHTDIHEIGRMVSELHSALARYLPLIEKITNNPAARWKARHNGNPR